ncbi:hypothetical protein [Parasitella parasitica]|uniref:Uncharacterized protein n=1 Tax=Parasitella parasitica TaxID=35722 RepID=A0A0B7NXZ5_9FUNG|nr:hypothetical protein [Parasitella parasitica]
MAVTTSPTTRAPSHTIIGAMSKVGVMNLIIRGPKQPSKAQQLAITCNSARDLGRFRQVQRNEGVWHNPFEMSDNNDPINDFFNYTEAEKPLEKELSVDIQ